MMLSENQYKEAVSWAEQKLKYAMSLLGVATDLREVTEALGAVEVGITNAVIREAEERAANGDKSLSSEEKRRNEVRRRLLADDDAIAHDLSIMNLREKQGKLKADHEFASDMLKCCLAFTYADTPIITMGKENNGDWSD